MSITAYYRAQAQRCLALSRSYSDRKQALQLAFMATRYFARAEELARGVPFFSELTRSILQKHGSRRAYNIPMVTKLVATCRNARLTNCAHRTLRRDAVLRGYRGTKASRSARASAVVT